MFVFPIATSGEQGHDQNVSGRGSLQVPNNAALPHWQSHTPKILTMHFFLYDPLLL